MLTALAAHASADYTFPQTTVTITSAGRDAIDGHWKRMESERQAAAAWS